MDERINKKKLLKRKFKWFLKVLVTIVVVLLFISVINYTLGSVEGNVSKNFFELNNGYDYFIVALISISFLLPVALLVLEKFKKIPLSDFEFSLNIFSLAFSIPSVIFLVFYSDEETLKYIQKTITFNKFYLFLVITTMLLGVLITIYRVKLKFKKNNWYLFFVLVPYILVSSVIQRDFTNYFNFINSKDFNVATLKEMLESTNGNVWLMNDFYYLAIAIPVITLIIGIGVKTSEVIWKKQEKR